MPAAGAKPDALSPKLWPDARLVKECLRGNEAAWDALLAKYKNLIFSIPIKHGFSRDDAADVFQAVCAELIAGLPRLRKPQALAAWLIQVTSHKCNLWRQQSNRFAGDEGLGSRAAPDSAAPHHLVSQLEREQNLRESLMELPPRCRRLVQLLFFQSPALPYEEVAKELGIAKGSIGFIRARCLSKLRKRLEKLV